MKHPVLYNILIHICIFGFELKTFCFIIFSISTATDFRKGKMHAKSLIDFLVNLSIIILSSVVKLFIL